MSMDEHPFAVFGMELTSEGKMLVTVSKSGRASLWDPITGRVLGRLPCEQAVRSVSWQGTQARLTSVDDIGTLRTWDLSDVSRIREVSHAATGLDSLTKIAWSPKGDFLAAMGDTPVAFFWPVGELDKPPRELKAHTAPLNDLKWHQNGSWLARRS